MIPRRKSLLPPTKRIKRSRVKRVNPARRKSEFVRCYHSKERVEFVKGLACSACGGEGFSENAHVAPSSEKGTGYKAGYLWIAPMCANRRQVVPGGLRVTIGCHAMYDEYRWDFDEQFPGFDAEMACAETEKLWLEASA